MYLLDFDLCDSTTGQLVKARRTLLHAHETIGNLRHYGDERD